MQLSLFNQYETLNDCFILLTIQFEQQLLTVIQKLPTILNNNIMNLLQVPMSSPARSFKSTRVPMLVKCVEGKDIQGNMLLNDYVFRHQLGEGSYGDVFVIQKEENGIFKKFAVKILKRKKPQQKRFGKKTSEIKSESIMDDDIRNEIKAMKSIHHKNIVAIKQVICNDQKQFLYIVMEYCHNGEMIEWVEEECMFKFRKERPRLSEQEIRKLARDCLKALQAIFMNQLVHRDIKPQNILFDEYNNAKMCDFGVVTQIDQDCLKDVKGTLMFHSPQIVKKEFPIKGRAADIWALGVSIYCFAYLKHPFVHQYCEEVVDECSKNTVQEEVTFPSDNSYSDDFKNFIRKMLIKDPEERCSINQLLNDPWLNQGYEFNAHDEVMREMKHQFQLQIEKKPQLSLFQFVMIKHYIRSFKKRYAQKMKLKNPYGFDEVDRSVFLGSNTLFHNQPSVIQVQTKSMFKFQIKNPTLCLKIYLVNSQFEIRVIIPSNQWGLEFVLMNNKGETWSSCSVALDRVNELFQRGRKRWTRQEFIIVIKKMVRLMKVVEKKLIFEFE